MFDDAKRRLGALFLIGLLVAGAGCSALGGTNAQSTTETESTPAVQSTAQTDKGTSTETPHEGETTDDGHSHDQTHRVESADTTEVPVEDANRSVNTTGKLTVVVGDSELDLRSRDTDGDGFDLEDDPHTWYGESNTTLSAALERFDITVRSDELSVDGETYRSSPSGTTLVYRVNGDPVDPESYTVQDGDQIWVSVETADMNRSTPGTYIDNEQQHIHGDMTVTVDGTTVDFGKSKYQSNDRYFHFEGSTGEYWHAHSWGLTLEYALSSLNGFSANGDAITYNGTTYDDSEPGTTVTVTVNGDPVDVDDYYLKDGDDVEITLEKS